jgi:hypothetical protein
MTSINDLKLGRAFLKSGFPITLPASYANFPQIPKLPLASGPMVAIGYKTERLTAVKSALWVRFTLPPEAETSSCTQKAKKRPGSWR